jgi:hypothetical protein
MKRPILYSIMSLVLLGIGSMQLSAQLKVNLNLTQRPDPYLTNWSKRPDIAVVTVVNSTSNVIEAKFKCVVNKDGKFLAETKNESMVVLSIPPGASQYFGADLVPMAAMRVAEGADVTAARTGMLPAGSYQFCVSLIDPVTSAVITQPVCKGFSVTSFQAGYASDVPVDWYFAASILPGDVSFAGLRGTAGADGHQCVPCQQADHGYWRYRYNAAPMAAGCRVASSGYDLRMERSCTE